MRKFELNSTEKWFVTEMCTLFRSGWKKRNIKNPESDAEHTTSLLILTLLISPIMIKLLRSLLLGWAHDAVEVISGDPIPGEKPEEMKAREENAAIKRLAKMLKKPEMEDLFAEFSANLTEEAKLVNALDKIDPVVQAYYYVSMGRAPKEVFEEFYSRALEHEKTQTPIAQEILRDIQSISFLAEIVGRMKDVKSSTHEGLSIAAAAFEKLTAVVLNTNWENEDLLMRSFIVILVKAMMESGTNVEQDLPYIFEAYLRVMKSEAVL